MRDKRMLLFCPHDAQMLKSELELDFQVSHESEPSGLAHHDFCGYDVIVILGMITRTWKGELGTDTEGHIGGYLHDGGTVILVHEAIYGGANPTLVKEILGLTETKALAADTIGGIDVYPSGSGRHRHIARLFEKCTVPAQELFDYRDDVSPDDMILSGVTHSLYGEEIRVPIAWVQEVGGGRALCSVLSHEPSWLVRHTRNVVLQGAWGLSYGERVRDIVFLTGAGASRPFGQPRERSDGQVTRGFPLMSDFLLEINDEINRSGDVSDAAKLVWQELFRRCEEEHQRDLERALEVLNLLASARFYDGLSVWWHVKGDSLDDGTRTAGLEGAGDEALTDGPTDQSAYGSVGRDKGPAAHPRESARELLLKIRWLIRQRLSKLSKGFHHCECWRSLCGADLPLRVVAFATTNYDRIHELALRDMGVDHVDGFVETAWEPSAFAEHLGVPRLFKLHGSIDWLRAVESGSISRSEVIAQEATHSDTGELMSEVVIYPTEAKTLAQEPFAEIFCRFREAMLALNGTLIIVGHSLRDEEIVGVVKEALLRNRSLQLIVVDPNADALIDNQLGDEWRDRVAPLQVEFGDRRAVVAVRRTLWKLSSDALASRHPTTIQFDSPGPATAVGWEFGEGSGDAEVQRLETGSQLLLCVRDGGRKWALDYSFPVGVVADALTVRLKCDSTFSFYLRVRLSDRSCRWLNYTSGKEEGWKKRASSGEWRIGLGNAKCTGSLEEVARDIFEDVAMTYGQNGRFLDRVLAFRIREEWHLHSVTLGWHGNA